MDHLPQPPSSSVDESNGPHESGQEVVGESPELLHMLSAYKFVSQVKETYMDDIGKYKQFLYVMKQLGAKRMNKVEAISRVKELFRDRQELLVGFNAFLPSEYEIAIPLQDMEISRAPESDDDSSQGTSPRLQAALRVLNL